MDDMKCCQIGIDGAACKEKAVAVHKNKPLCTKCFLGTMKHEQDMNKRRTYEAMIKNAIRR